jgi:hypothetical protein
MYLFFAIFTGLSYKSIEKAVERELELAGEGVGAAGGNWAIAGTATCTGGSYGTAIF